MSVAVVATICGADSNSYITLAEAQNMIEDRLENDVKNAWLALTVNNQERFLILACRKIEQAHQYLGRKVTDLTGETAQALQFPRFSFDYAGGKANIEAYRAGAGYAIDQRVKNAQVAEAMSLVYLAEIVGAPMPMGGSVRQMLQAEGVKSIRIGNTAEDYSGKSQGLCDEADNWLRPIIRRSHQV